MLLTVDIGNTNLTVGLSRDGSIAGTRRATTRPSQTADELELLIDELLQLEGVSLDDVAAVACSSVVPSLTAALETVAERHALPLLVAGAGRIPIPVRVDRPAEVGADRLVNALAAARLYGVPAVVVDFGTATTFDAVGPDGAYLGGAIAPGLELGLDALATRTAKLPRIDLRVPEWVIGRDTVTAMQAGAVFGYQALTEGLLARMRDELAGQTGVEPSAVRVILTGGLSRAPWALALHGVDVIDPDLTLKGLAILHAELGGG
jgi:type III pantothenate kinase